MQQAKTEVAQPAQRASQLATQHQQRNSSAVQSEFADLRQQATAQRQLQDAANNSPQSHQLNTFQQMAQNSARSTQLKAMSTMMNAPAVQRVEEDEPLNSTPEKDDNIADGTGKRQGEQFEARGEQHTLWVESVGGMRLIMIASNPVPVVTRLRKWQAAAKKVKDVALKNGMDRLLDLAWKKYGALQNASAIEDGDERARAIRLAQQQLSSDWVNYSAFSVNCSKRRRVRSQCIEDCISPPTGTQAWPHGGSGKCALLRRCQSRR
jgi:hypothetical protein